LSFDHANVVPFKLLTTKNELYAEVVYVSQGSVVTFFSWG